MTCPHCGGFDCGGYDDHDSGRVVGHGDDSFYDSGRVDAGAVAAARGKSFAPLGGPQEAAGRPEGPTEEQCQVALLDGLSRASTALKTWAGIAPLGVKRRGVEFLATQVDDLYRIASNLRRTT